MITALRRWVRDHVPDGPRLAVALARRELRDRVTGDTRRMARSTACNDRLSFRIVEVVQDIRTTAFVEGKLENIRLGAARLDGVVVAPGKIFSFWQLVGRPSAAAGFQLGRAIRGGAVGGDVGGGLCQISGIVYEVGLRAGLDPIERHPHSRDLYTEEDRFTQLGLDAAVVWPYKDVRLVNALDVPVTFRVAVDDMRLSTSLHAPKSIAPMTLEIERIDHTDRRDVRVSRGRTLISDDRYAVLARE